MGVQSAIPIREISKTIHLNTQLEEKRDRLLHWFSNHRPVVVAFSGGVDSTVLAQAAFLSLGEDASAMTAVSPSLSASEQQACLELATLIGIQHRFVKTNEFEREEYRRNAPDRCYFCKDTLYAAIQPALTSHPGTVVNGANLDDQGDHRPGMRAASDHEVLSPLIEVGLNKSEIRELARHWNLPVWDKPASPCLSSRIRYGLEVTPERTRMVELGEKWLRTELAINDLRVRLEHHNTARIEVPIDTLPRLVQDPIRTEMISAFEGFGFQYVTLDVAGLRSGSMNAIVPLEQLEILNDSGKSTS